MKSSEANFIIVEAAASHIPALRDIFLDGRKAIDPYATAMGIDLNDFDRETAGELILVALRNQHPIGFISIWLADNFIHHLYVEDADQSRGTGSALLHAGLEKLKGRAALKCFVSNTRAVNFYQDRGFKIVQTVAADAGDYYLMTLSIDSSQ